MANRRKATIDFETFSEVNVTKTSPWAYAEHPSTKVLCMGFRFEDMDKTLIWVPGKSIPASDSAGLSWTCLHIEAHNSEFERAIWETIMVPLYGFTEDVTWECTAARAAALALPRSLDDVNPVLGLSTVKSKEGHALMMKMCKPKKATQKDSRLNYLDDTEMLQDLYTYCLADVDAEVALSKKIRPLSAKEMEVWRVDQTINRRGICFDPELVQAAMKLWEQKKAKLHAEMEAVTDGFVEKGTQVKKLLTWVQNQEGFDYVESMNKDAIEALFLRVKPLPPKLRRALQIRREVSKSSVAKYEAIWKRQSADGRCRGLFMYHGATTGRWAGKGIQMHNLPAGRALPKFDQELCIETAKTGDLALMECLYDPPMDYLSACIRGAFVPAEGKTFACADYASIEARVLLWLVGDEPALKMFRDGVCIYSDLAARIYGVPVEDIKKDDIERQVGKQGILGLGFQMGVDKFIATCERYGIEMSRELAQTVVDTYRQTYWKTKNFWSDVENAAIRCVRTGEFQICGKIIWVLEGDFLHCSLPSDRLLSYYKPRLKELELPWSTEEKPAFKDALHFDGPLENHGFGEQHTYGGKLTENIVQAIARDVLAEAMVRLEKHEFPIVMHVHDEVLVEICPEQMEPWKMVEEHFEHLMSEPPAWAPDLPIAIDTWYGNRYHK